MMDEKTQGELKAAIGKYEEARADLDKIEAAMAEADGNRAAALKRQEEATLIVGGILTVNGLDGVVIGPKLYRKESGELWVSRILQVDAPVAGAVVEVGAPV